MSMKYNLFYLYKEQRDPCNIQKYFDFMFHSQMLVQEF